MNIPELITNPFNFWTEPTSTGSKMRAMAIMIITNVCAGQSSGVYSPYPTVLKVTTTNQRHTIKSHFEAGLSRWWMPHTLSEITSNNYCSLTSNHFLLLFSFSLAHFHRKVGDGTKFYSVGMAFHVYDLSMARCIT